MSPLNVASESTVLSHLYNTKRYDAYILYSILVNGTRLCVPLPCSTTQDRLWPEAGFKPGSGFLLEVRQEM